MQNRFMKKMILMMMAALLLVLGAIVGTQVFLYPKAQVAVSTHHPAPDFTLPDAQGKAFTLSSQRGHKVVINFYRGYW